MAISAERWKQIDELLDAALDLPPAQRAEFLDKACAGDSELRLRVDSLLRSETEAKSFIETPAAAFAAEMLIENKYSARIDGSQPGRRIQRYKILSRLGAGGMGEVWLAEDTRLGRKVALKLLPERFTRDVARVRRFELEGRAASALNHPNIITIHDIGQFDETYYIATELIEGQTLRQRLKDARLTLTEALDTAKQAASALAAAHAAGIVHRDIKPENIMLRPDGVVKVLDFGLAKLSEARPPDDPQLTEPGMVMGTISYMSPEQARGLEADERSDLFCLGVVLYEMLTGGKPFTGATAADVMSAILTQEPPLAPGAPKPLAQILHRALRKNRDDRYQTAQELLSDLEALKHDLDLEAHLSRKRPLLAALRRHKRAAGAGLAALLAVAASLFYFFPRTPPALTDKDTVLLADFVNTTGDAVFDGALKQALAVQLEQSPYLSLFPEQHARQTLRLMNRPTTAPFTGETAREICQRNGIKALLGGTIAPLGSHFVITLEAVNAATGEVIARQLAESGSKEQVLKTLGEAATELRGKFGESLGSIQKFDKPLAQVTTSSLDALKAYSQGVEQKLSGKEPAAIPFFRRAIELDQSFARAYADLSTAYYNLNSYELAEQFSEKAWSLRDRVSERENFYISWQYYKMVLGNLEKCSEILELWKRTYPRDYLPLANLSNNHSGVGEFEKSVEQARASLELNPKNAIARANLAYDLINLNRFDEARQVLGQTLAQKLDSFSSHASLRALAFIQGDSAAALRQDEWARGTPAEPYMLSEQAGTLGIAGRLRQAREVKRRAIAMLEGKDNEVAGRWAFISALREAAYGNCAQARSDAANSLAMVRNRYQRGGAAVALALCGEAARSQQIMNDLAKRFPQDTFINAMFRPAVLACIELARNQPRRAFEFLEPSRRYELGNYGFLWPAYLRGLASLRQRAGGEAAREFQKLLDHRGFVIRNQIAPPYSLAQLGLARSLALGGEAAKAREAYEALFTMWKDADSDLTALREANAEFARLKQGSPPASIP